MVQCTDRFYGDDDIFGVQCRDEPIFYAVRDSRRGKQSAGRAAVGSTGDRTHFLAYMGRLNRTDPQAVAVLLYTELHWQDAAHISRVVPSSGRVCHYGNRLSAIDGNSSSRIRFISIPDVSRRCSRPIDGLCTRCDGSTDDSARLCSRQLVGCRRAYGTAVYGRGVRNGVACLIQYDAAWQAAKRCAIGR
ncbi:hypothetical protein D3C84_834560 [compost metagenome]